jgi:glycogen debranching enzyme
MLIISGNVFWVADDTGDATRGLFIDDTRHLSQWLLLLDGEPPTRLTAGALAPATRRGQNAPYTVLRTQAVDDGGLSEQLRIVNHLAAPRTVCVAYRVSVDFADQFEARYGHTFAKPGGRITRTGDTFHYRREHYQRQTVVSATQPPDAGPDTHITWRVRVPGHGEATLGISVGPDARTPQDPAKILAHTYADITTFVAAADIPSTDRPDLDAAARRGLHDLASMRVRVPALPALPIPGAGVPCVTLFGRDSALTALFALPYLPALARDVLRALAATQGVAIDPTRLEEPGKIIHELRSGELAAFDQVPYGRYYGSVDATPLFLMLLAAHRELATEQRTAARAAVDWMIHYGGLDEHGYLVYHTNGPGLVHQCWKDSPTSICSRTGEPADGPIAVAEAQGYAYAALRGVAALAREIWHDDRYAARLDARADRLRHDFVNDFWLDADGFVALALDGRRRQVDTLASNAGHVLWTGILDQDRGATVARRLGGDDFFSGWGIRTIAAGQPCHHAMSYHNGSVWPHDTAIAVAGMRRYGEHATADRVADGLIDAARHNGHRLPEVMSGLARGHAEWPIPYPHSCSPQAWAAAAPLLLIRRDI